MVSLVTQPTQPPVSDEPVALSARLTRPRGLARSALRFLIAVCCGALVWGGWYITKRGFSRSWRQFVISEFRKRGVDVSIQRLTLDPFHGVVAQDVEIVDSHDTSRALAVINRLILDINYSNLIRGKPFLDAVDLHNARLALPVDAADNDSPTIRVSGLNARLLFPPHQIYVPQAEADLYGIHIAASGRLTNPELYQPSKPSQKEEGKKRGALTRSVIEELKRIQYHREPLQMSIQFIGDLAEPDSLFAEATFWGSDISREGYMIKSLFANVTLRDGIFDLRKFAASDSKGSLEASGTYDKTAKTSHFQLHSTLDLSAINRSTRLFPALQQLSFTLPPRVELAGDTRFSPFAFLAVGSLSARSLAIGSVHFESLNADFSFDGERWFVSGLHALHHSGEVAADAMNTPGNFRLRLQSTLNPKALFPLLPAHVAQSLATLDFIQSPSLRLDIRGASTNPKGWEATAELRLRRTSFRDVSLKSAVSSLHFKDMQLTGDQFKIERDEGIGTGAFGYDFTRHEVRLTGVKATLNPTDVTTWIDPMVMRNVAPYHFKVRPMVSVNGTVQLSGGTNTNLEVVVDAPSGMNYLFLRKNLSSSSISGRLLFTEDRLQILGLNATLFGGKVRGGADISLARHDPRFTAQIEARDVDFEKLTKLYFDYSDSKGVLNGHYDFSGFGDNARLMKGRGEVTVTDGNVFAIPIFGPLSGFLNEIVPGIGYNVAHKASATFDIKEGVINTRDFVVDGRGFTMIGGGKVRFLDDKLDFDIRLNAKGLSGTLLFPVSKLLEYTSTGSLSKPAWRPKRLPPLLPH